MNKAKKIFSVLAVIAILLSAIPIVPVLAETYSGKCGENAIWELNSESGALTISGYGDMFDYERNDDAPWRGRGTIKSIVVESGITNIGKNAFAFCNMGTDITLPESITSIGDYAFYGSRFSRFVIPDSVKSIGSLAFSDCLNLSSINIPDSVKSIGHCAFSDCDLYSINIPEGIKELDEPFSGCGVQHLTINIKSVEQWCKINFKNSSVIGNTSISYGYSEGERYKYTYSLCVSGDIIENINVPETIKTIGRYTFANCSSIKNVILPEGIKEIGDSAFYRCSSLENIYLPDGITYIGEAAFYKSGLRNINIPEGIAKINKDTFWGCWDLESITFPNSLEMMEDHVFGGTAVKSINIKDIANWCNVEKSHDYHEYHNYSMFLNGESITNLVIPDSVVDLNNSFEFASNIKSIYIPKSVKNVGSFRGCTEIEEVTVDEDSPYYFVDSNCIIEKETKTLVSAFKNSEIPKNETVERIGDSAFWGHKYITELIIPENIKSIGVCAFSYCTELTSIKIPDSVTSIDSSAFSDTGYYNNDLNWENGALYISNHLITVNDCLCEYTIKDGTITIADGAFGNNNRLRIVTIPNSVTSISDHAFSNCTGLTSITIPNSVTSIGHHAFSYCTGLTSITIPNSVTSIGWGAFCGCTGLREVHTNDIVKWCNIDFRDCDSNPLYYAHNLYLNGEIAVNLVIPGNVTKIKDNAFVNCTSIENAVISDGAISIGHHAFSGCTGLTSITIPNSVTSIGWEAFSGCSKVTSLKLPDNIDIREIGTDAFKDCPAYEEHGSCIWSFDKTILTIRGDGIIKNYSQRKYSITKVILKQGITGINYAFSNCTGLTSITIPDSVTSIAYGAFSGCTGLTSITMPNGITSIEHNTFSGCTGLTSITIPNSVTSIGWEAFSDCTGLTSITIPNSVTSISRDVFSGCNNLTINCYKNSEAYRYAISHNIPYCLIKDNTFAPSAPTVLSKTANSVTLKSISGYEYKMDNGEWHKSNVFTGLSEDTEYTFYQRIAETDTTYASESSAPLKVRTYFCGDINGDGKINSTDLAMLRKNIISGNTDYAENPQCDIKIDGKIDILDLIKLKKLAVEKA